MAFRLEKKYMKLIGIFLTPKQNFPSLLRKWRWIINFIHVAFIGINLFLYLSSLAYFLMFKAKKIFIIFQAIFFTTVTLMRVILFFLILYKRSELLTLMNDLEQIVESREY